ncbi:hypothetical protein TBR22_A02240 [Luteitalea sp. TBR-22]|uniref:DUF3500 domain-containing protein n=1 Tax=Luteitalea sp. TBR-22 TaxID=2802971 RepID=UPI001AF9CC3C|nr:DUF3500 domain-containing protein [Luteitalea sp. TBR-22]BCS31025.1 hypothetical protein TBR22_A02240 [Luteitalea sp. TBR-22]
MARRTSVLVLATMLACAVGAGLGAWRLAAQAPAPQAGPARLAEWAKRSREMEAKGTAEPFRGITTDGTPAPGLFAVRSTGVSTAPVVKAATAFLAALTDEQRARSTFAVDNDEWRKWMNQHFYRRAGVSFEEMTPAQREAAFGLMRASLSARGLALSRDVMRLNHTLGELNGNDFEAYGEWLYHVTVMGTPSATEPWGWQVDGHHLIINYFVLGDQVVMTPSFFGSEPVIATTGKYAGTKILQEEQAAGLALVNALAPEHRARAILRDTKTANDNQTEAFRDNVVMPFAGVPAGSLPAPQQAALLDLVALHVGRMDDGHARVKMSEVEAHLAETHFAWIGGTAPDSVFYYRIHSPVVLIEFDHQTPAGLRGRYPAGVPFREHIHVVVRTPNGNDYGKDLLRQHYAQHPHAAARGRAIPGLPLDALAPR